MFRHSIAPDASLALLELHHAPALFDAVDHNRGHLGAWFPWVVKNTEVTHTAAFIQGQLDAWAKGTGLCCGIWQGDRLVGTIGCHAVHASWKSVEIGYWLVEDATGQGLMTRACAAMIDYLVHQRGMHRIVIKARSDNAPSRAVAERHGFVYEGTERAGMKLGNAFWDIVVYSLLAPEWRTLKSGERFHADRPHDDV